jgi:hypothetical protein
MLITDIDLIFDDGSACSLCHCVSKAMTKKEIVEYNEFWFTPEGKEIAMRCWKGPTPLMIAIRNYPDNVLNNDGTLKITEIKET